MKYNQCEILIRIARWKELNCSISDLTWNICFVYPSKLRMTTWVIPFPARRSQRDQRQKLSLTQQPPDQTTRCHNSLMSSQCRVSVLVVNFWQICFYRGNVIRIRNVKQGIVFNVIFRPINWVATNENQRCIRNMQVLIVSSRFRNFRCCSLTSW